MLISTLFIGLLVISGYLVKLPRETRFVFPKAVLLVIVEGILAMIAFALFFGFTLVTGLFNLLLAGADSIFIIVLFIALLNGLLLYWLQELTYDRLGVNQQVLTLGEYIIQWSLIYITVYQVLFDSLFSKSQVTNLIKLELTSPNNMMVAILPALISVWIAIIIYKLKHHYL